MNTGSYTSSMPRVYWWGHSPETGVCLILVLVPRTVNAFYIRQSLVNEAEITLVVQTGTQDSASSRWTLQLFRLLSQTPSCLFFWPQDSCFPLFPVGQLQLEPNYHFNYSATTQAIRWPGRLVALLGGKRCWFDLEFPKTEEGLEPRTPSSRKNTPTTGCSAKGGLHHYVLLVKADVLQGCLVIQPL